MDINRFVLEREAGWKELEEMLQRIAMRGRRSFSRSELRRLVRLYRQASSDLIEARSQVQRAELVGYLNALVARAYGEVYTASGFDFRAVGTFFATGFPALFRRHARYALAAFALFATGMLTGWAGVLIDPSAREWLVPAEHRELDPAQRVAELESGSEAGSAVEAAAFSSFLFTHNIRVAFAAFALGITLGIGTVAVLFSNGVMLGALAADYQQGGVSLFFWAWILPHGVPEIGSIIVAGAAGLVLARSLLFPGDRSLRRSFAESGPLAVRLVLGTIPAFVLAGIVEGGFSQIHEPRLPYLVKLGVASLEAVLLWAWLRRGSAEDPGRDPVEGPREHRLSAPNY